MSIKIENLKYQYKEDGAEAAYALNGINVEITKGEFIGIIGHTGSGKSTFVQHLNGLLKATEGSYYFDGTDVYGKNYCLKDLRGHVGITFQYPEHQLFETSVLQDVCFGPLNMGLSKEEAEEEAKKALQIVDLSEEYYEKSPYELSGGEKRRVAIAGVLAMHPEYFILDEPTAGLDPKGREHILNLLLSLNKEQNITIILVSHSMEDIARVAGRVFVMEKGQIIMDDTPKNIFHNKDKLESIGLGVPESAYFTHKLREIGFTKQENALTIDEVETLILNELNSKKNAEERHL